MAFFFVAPKPSLVATFVLLILVSPTTSVLASSSIEHCLRTIFYSPPPPPAVGSPAWFDIGEIVCEDIFRAEMYYLRETGHLSFEHLEALCNILENNEAKVEHYIRKSFPNYDVQQLIDGNSCPSIRLRPKPPSPSV